MNAPPLALRLSCALFCVKDGTCLLFLASTYKPIEWNWVRNLTFGRRVNVALVSLGLPFNQARTTLLKWSRDGAVKLKAGSHGLELYTSSTGTVFGFPHCLQAIEYGPCVNTRQLIL